MGRADEAADHPLQVDPHRGLVDGGLQRLGGEADVMLGRLANAVVVDRVEPEGAAEPADEAERRRVSGNRLQSDHHGRAAGHRGWCSRFCQAVPVADLDQSLKAPKATNPETRIFPLGVRAVLGRAVSGGKRRLRQGRAASCAEQASVEKKYPATHHQILSLAAPRLPQPDPARRHLRRPPDARPSQTAPERKDAGIGFANLSGK